MGTVSKAQICNLALSHISQTETRISNLDTDKGTTAIECRIHYDVARRFVLADHEWNFAKKRLALADIGSPPTQWGYRYDYPSDCLKMREIERATRHERPIPFDVEDDGTGNGLCILTDQNAAKGIFTRDVENTALFIPSFVSAFGWYLASELAPAIAGDLKRQELCLKVYQSHIAAAQAANSAEGTADEELDSPWQQARSNGTTHDNHGRIIEG